LHSRGLGSTYNLGLVTAWEFHQPHEDPSVQPLRHPYVCHASNRRIRDLARCPRPPSSFASSEFAVYGRPKARKTLLRVYNCACIHPGGALSPILVWSLQLNHPSETRTERQESITHSQLEATQTARSRVIFHGGTGQLRRVGPQHEGVGYRRNHETSCLKMGTTVAFADAERLFSLNPPDFQFLT